MRPGALVIEGHVQGLSNTRSLGEAGIPVFVVDKSKCIASKSKYCKKFFLCPDFQTDAFIDFLIDMATKENISGWVLIPSNDHAVYSIAKHKNRLQQYYKVLVPDLSIVEKIYDKSKLLEVASQCRIPVPVTQYFSSADEKNHEELGFPVITKGRNGLSFYKAIGKKALLANNAQELRRQLLMIDSRYRITGTFTQELIPYDGSNKTVSFTAFCVAGEIKTCWMGIKLREHPLQFGTATYAKSIYVQECYNQSAILIRALGYTGVCEIEYLYDPRQKQYKLIELNARTWLWVGLAKACGINYARMLYDYANEIEINYPKTYNTELYWISPVSDFAYSMLAIFNGSLSPIRYLKSVFSRNKVNALFIAGDLKPGFSYLLNLLEFILRR